MAAGLFDALFDTLENCRDELVRAFQKLNPALDDDSLAEAAQRTLNRLIFMRFLEGRLVEAGIPATWQDFLATSRRLDAVCNGVAFKKHPILDSPDFRVDSETFAGICRELAGGFSSGHPDTVPIHILGLVYERFLGKSIVIDGGRICGKGKSTTRKAGGVFYTPGHIVRYIVENTVGRLIEGKTPDEIAEMRFADIACGGGAFLMEMYDALLRHHAKYYDEHPGKARKGDCVRSGDGSLRLSAGRKREILLNNIIGVDIDPQAVEVAQLSLFLKLLEDETVASATVFQTRFHHGLLPSLDKNIVCGNALIGPDILRMAGLTAETARRLNPMDFGKVFPKIFGSAPSPKVSATIGKAGERGSLKKSRAASPQPSPPLRGGEGVSHAHPAEPARGFDAVVGNPPYVFGEFLNPLEKDYFAAHYATGRGQYDLYHLFFERALRLTRSGGYHGYIVPDAVLARDETVRVRRLLLEKNTVTAICHVGAAFPDAGVSTAVILTRKGAGTGKNARVALHQIAEPGVVVSERNVSLSRFSRDPKMAFAIEIADAEAGLLEKIRSQPHRLQEWCEFSRGEELGKKHFQRQAGLRPGFVWILAGENVHRYALGKPVFQIPGRAVRKDAGLYAAPKLVIVKTGARPQATLETRGLPTLQSLYNGRFQNPGGIRPEFVLAIVNSALTAWYLRKTVTAYKKLFPQFNQNHFAELPIPRIDVSRRAGRLRHDRLVALVKQMLATRQKQDVARNKAGRNSCETKGTVLDRKIDRLVYELYSLTGRDVRIIQRDNARTKRA